MYVGFFLVSLNTAIYTLSPGWDFDKIEKFFYGPGGRKAWLGYEAKMKGASRVDLVSARAPTASCSPLPVVAPKILISVFKNL